MLLGFYFALWFLSFKITSTIQDRLNNKFHTRLRIFQNGIVFKTIKTKRLFALYAFLTKLTQNCFSVCIFYFRKYLSNVIKAKTMRVQTQSSYFLLPCGANSTYTRLSVTIARSSTAIHPNCVKYTLSENIPTRRRTHQKAISLGNRGIFRLSRLKAMQTTTQRTLAQTEWSIKLSAMK